MNPNLLIDIANEYVGFSRDELTAGEDGFSKLEMNILNKLIKDGRFLKWEKDAEHPDIPAFDRLVTNKEENVIPCTKFISHEEEKHWGMNLEGIED